MANAKKALAFLPLRRMVRGLRMEIYLAAMFRLFCASEIKDLGILGSLLIEANNVN